MKKIIRNTVTAALTLLLMGGGIWYLSDLTERKDSRNKFEEFYQEEEPYDVLFLGQSHVINGIFPMELWKEYGIVSYNLAGHANRIALNYWVLRNALEYTEPKLIVMDMAMIGREDKLASLEQLHISADHIPYSSLKQEMIDDLVEDKDRRTDFLWKFSTYHHRWNDLTEDDFHFIPSPEKGAESRINVAVPAVNMELDPEEFLEGETTGTKYLRKVLDLCKEREIEVLLTYLPFPDDTGWRYEVPLAEEVAKEYGVNFLDYDTLYPLINPATDFYDRDSHLNPSGARKITEYIGAYIVENYDIDDHREDEQYDHWYEAEEAYYQFKLDTFKQEEELKNILMLLSDEEIAYGIYLKPDGEWKNHPVLLELLKNIGIVTEEFTDHGQVFVIEDREQKKKITVPLFEEVETEYGLFNFFYNKDGHLELSCSKSSPMTITFADVAIMIFDQYRVSPVTQKSFTLAENDLEFTVDTD